MPVCSGVSLSIHPDVHDFQMRNSKILVGTPCYGGLISSRYFHSVLSAQSALQEQGVEWEFITRSSESLITRGRNSIVAHFLGRTDCTHLLFIDADIGFSHLNILRLLDKNEPLTATACAMKGLNWKRAQQVALSGAESDVIKTAALEFAINLGTDNKAPINIQNGFVEADAAGTAFMLIQRDVFPQMQLAYPECHYQNDVAGYDDRFSRGNFWSFFDTIVDKETGRYLSEDYTFCQRWKKGCGGKIFVDIQTTLSHNGSYEYSGSFLDWIKCQQ